LHPRLAGTLQDPGHEDRKSDSIEKITPGHWQKLAEETATNWPLLRQRLRNPLGGSNTEAIRRKRYGDGKRYGKAIRGRK
jgi:hypothetical protein